MLFFLIFEQFFASFICFIPQLQLSLLIHVEMLVFDFLINLVFRKLLHFLRILPNYTILEFLHLRWRFLNISDCIIYHAWLPEPLVAFQLFIFNVAACVAVTCEWISVFCGLLFWALNILILFWKCIIVHFDFTLPWRTVLFWS